MAAGFISYVGEASGTNTATLPTHQVGDIAFVFAFRDGSVTVPTVPAGWTSINAPAGANTASHAFGFRVMIAGDTSTGTWTNATDLSVVIFRGVNATIQSANVTTANATASTQINYAALVTFKFTDGSSWVLGMAADKTQTINAKAATSMTTRASSRTVMQQHTGENISVFASTNYTTTITADVWRTVTLELVSGRQGYGQPQADIKATGRGFAQAQADIKTTTPTAITLPTITTFYLHDALSPDTGTLPTSQVVTVSVDATATNANVNRLTDQFIGGPGQVQSENATALGSGNQNAYMRRFLSPPLAAQTLNQTVTVLLGQVLSSGDAAANPSIIIYASVWRPSTGAIVASSIYAAALGVADPTLTTPQSFGTTSGSISSTAVLDGDILVLELFVNQNVAGKAIPAAVVYDGSNPSVFTNTNATTAAAFFQVSSPIKLLSYSTLNGRPFGQAQARITAIGRGYGQAAVLVAGTSSQATDTFTRTTSNGWGTADAGGAWTITNGTVADFSTNGSVAQIANADQTHRIDLNTLLMTPSNGIEGILTYSFANIPTSGTYRLWFDFYQGSLSAETLKAGLWYTSDGLVQCIWSDMGTTSGAGTKPAYTPGDLWYLKFQVTQTNGTHHPKVKTWKVGTAEPAWNDNTVADGGDRAGVYPPGHVRIGTEGASGSPSVTLTIDNVGVYSYPEVYAQAQASIQRTFTGLGQAQAKITAVGFGFGQAQAYIEPNRAFGQAQALINGTSTSVVDTFTRTVSSGWGTADTGGAWTVVSGTPADFNVSGTEGSIANINNLPIVSLKTFILGNQEGYAKIKISALPGTGTGTIFFSANQGSSNDNVAGILKNGLGFQIDSLGHLFINPVVNGAADVTVAGTYTPGDYWWVKWRVLQTSTQTTSFVRGWKDGDPEPGGWLASKTSSVISYPGHFAIFGLLSVGSPTATFDNINIYAASPVGSGQAQADILAQGFGKAQAQADILTQGFGTGQAKTDIKQTGFGLGQAQVDIKATSFGLGQAQADILHTSFGLGQAQAKILVGFSGVFGQAQASIQHTYFGSAQAQADILYTSFGLAQANADIKNQSVAYSTPVAQANADILTQGFGKAQSQADIKVTKFGLGQAQADIQHTYFGLGQAQTDIKVTSFGLAQAQADIKATKFGEGQAQADILRTSFGLAQAQADVKMVRFGLGQAQADIKVTSFVEAQAQADIKQTYFGSAQAQADIKVTSFGLAQANADIIRTNFAEAQAQADIKQTYYGLGQAQTDIKVTSFGFGQSQTDIKQTSFGLAQAQATIQANRFGQAQADIKVTSFVWAQAQARIQNTYFGLGQAQADVTASSFAVAQAQADIKQVGYGEGQAQTDIKQTYFGEAQAQASIQHTYFGLGQAQADIKQTSFGEGQANADIKAVGYGEGQAQVDIKAKGYGFGQAKVWISIPYGLGQAQAFMAGQGLVYGQAKTDIKTTSYVFGQAQADIKQVSYGEGQAQADILRTSFGSGQAQADIKVTSFGEGQAQTDIKQTYYAKGQAQADIKQTYFGNGQAQADIKSVGYGFGQACADIKSTVYGFGQAQCSVTSGTTRSAQAQADIKSKGYGFGQANSDIKSVGYGTGQAQTDIKVTSFGSGQAQASIAHTAFGFGQAQVAIKATGRAFAQAQADLRTSYEATGQAQADIKAVGYGFGQAQARIVLTGVNASGQAQATIRGNVYGQAQVDIKTTYVVFAQSQADIKVSVNKYGQANALIKVSAYGTGQAQAKIASQNNLVFGQAQAVITLLGLNAYAQAQAFILKSAGYGQAAALVIQTHTLKKLVLTDRYSMGLSITDIERDTLVESDQSLTLTLSDKGAGKVTLTDSGMGTLRLSDKEYYQ